MFEVGLFFSPVPIRSDSALLSPGRNLANRAPQFVGDRMNKNRELSRRGRSATQRPVRSSRAAVGETKKRRAGSGWPRYRRLPTSTCSLFPFAELGRVGVVALSFSRGPVDRRRGGFVTRPRRSTYVIERKARGESALIGSGSQFTRFDLRNPQIGGAVLASRSSSSSRARAGHK